MKAHVPARNKLSVKQKKDMTDFAFEVFDCEVLYVVARDSAMWLTAMYNCGVPVDVINNCIEEYKNVYDSFGGYRRDKVGDQALQDGLDYIGVKYNMGVNEL